MKLNFNRKSRMKTNKKKEGNRIGYHCDKCKEDFDVDSLELEEVDIGNFFNTIHKKCGSTTISINEY